LLNVKLHHRQHETLRGRATSRSARPGERIDGASVRADARQATMVGEQLVERLHVTRKCTIESRGQLFVEGREVPARTVDAVAPPQPRRGSKGVVGGKVAATAGEFGAALQPMTLAPTP
jgi:hypothetical protein